jgi:CBS domain-containing protein/ribosome-associated translation inhibitor RaiA
MAGLEMNKVTAKEVMKKKVVTVAPHERLSDVIGKMRKHAIFELPVVEKGNKIVGMVGYDVLMKRRKLPLFTEVEHIMTPAPKISEDTPLLEITEKMLVTGHKSLPVTEKNKLVGIISIESVCNLIPKVKDLAALEISSIMTPSPMCVFEGDKIAAAKNVMKGLEENFVPVVNKGGKLTGVVGSRELIKLRMRNAYNTEDQGEVAGEKTKVGIIIKSVMREDPVISKPEDKLGEVCSIMRKMKVPSVIVMDDSKPIGVVTHEDILEVITRKREGDGVYIQISGLEEEEPEDYEAMYEMIGKTMGHINKLQKPTIFLVHVHEHRHEHGEIKYSLRGRLSTERGMYFANDFDWNLLRCLDKILDHLEHQVKKDKDIRTDKHKQPSKRHK